MPMMETGRGWLPGLLATDCASLEFVTWWNTESTPLGENVVPEADDLLVGHLPHGVERAADRQSSSADRRRRLLDLDAEVAAVVEALARRP